MEGKGKSEKKETKKKKHGPPLRKKKKRKKGGKKNGYKYIVIGAIMKFESYTLETYYRIYNQRYIEFRYVLLMRYTFARSMNP